MTCHSINCFKGIQDFFKNHETTISHVIDVVKRVIEVASIALASAALILYSPFAFFGGLFIGALFKEELANRIDDPINLFHKNIGTRIGLITLGVLAWPLALELSSLWAGARWSVYLLS